MKIFKKLKSLFKKAEKPKKKPIPKPKEKIKIVKPEAKKPPVRKKDISDAYKILKVPHISEKATILSESNKYVFKVYQRANKIEIRKTIEDLYGVSVKNVNIINIHRKRRVLRGREGFKTGYKKAIVTLEKGQKIEILPH